MDDKDLGRLPDGTGPSSQATEPVPVSALPSAAIGFTGTQHTVTARQRIALFGLLTAFRNGGTLWMHNGDCINADTIAACFWRSIGGKLHLWPPENPAKRAWLAADITEREKGYITRNRDIVNSSEAVIATPREMTEQARGGTWSTIRYARLRELPLAIVFPDGSVATERWPAIAMEARQGGDPQGLHAEGTTARPEGIAQKGPA